MRKKKRRRIIFGIVTIIIVIIGFVFYQDGLINKLSSADVDYKLSYELTNNNNSIIITLDRERHSGNFKEVYFGIVDNNIANLTQINNKNYNSLNYTFNDKISLKNYGIKNNMGMIKLEYNFNNINELSNSYNILHIALLGNNNKNQYYTVIYYLNDENKLTLKILNTDEIYNYSVLESLANQLNKSLNINITVADLSNKLVNERDIIKEHLLS